jgi:sporulation protein YlmC with PRC-barrel domain
MRLADVLGSVVVDVDGREVGDVGDLWLAQDAAPIGPFGASLRIDVLVIGRFGLASRAGYDRDGIQGPAPIAWWFHRRTANRPVASWSDVAAVEEGRIRLRGRVEDLDRPRSIHEALEGAKHWSAGLQLLDRQLVDRDGRMAGKVDDLELELHDDGPPVVTAILAGPGALARRIGGRFGAWIASVHARLHPEEGGPARISFGAVARIDDHVTLTVSREDVDTYRAERWVAEHVIERIPGAR